MSSERHKTSTDTTVKAASERRLLERRTEEIKYRTYRQITIRRLIKERKIPAHLGSNLEHGYRLWNLGSRSPQNAKSEAIRLRSTGRLRAILDAYEPEELRRYMDLIRDEAKPKSSYDNSSTAGDDEKSRRKDQPRQKYTFKNGVTLELAPAGVRIANQLESNPGLHNSTRYLGEVGYPDESDPVKAANNASSMIKNLNDRIVEHGIEIISVPNPEKKRGSLSYDIKYDEKGLNSS